MPTPDHQKQPHTTITKTEWKLFLLVIILGIVVRVVWLSHATVEHYDEGVYASNVLSETGEYPSRHLYAPPLFPFLVEIAQLFLSPSHLGTLLVSLLAGCGTILLVWQVGRRWFGAEAGIAAATFAAFSDFHILYSRMVLTDVLLCFWLLLAVWLIWESFRKADFRWGATAGVATGLAWATKYNGWLAVAIGISGLIAWAVATKASAKVFKRNILLWAIIAIVAGTVWSPVLFGLPDPGYSAVSENHAKYIVGLSGWVDSAVRQYRNHRYLDGWISCVGVGLALLFAQLLRDIHQQAPRPGFTWNGLPHYFVRRLQLPLAFTGIALFIGSSSLLFLLSFIMLVWHGIWHWKNRTTIKMSEPVWMRSLAFWLLAAWTISLIVGTPLYHPYPRLTLPLLVALWLGAAFLISRYTQMLHSGEAVSPPASSPPNNVMVNSLSTICMLVIMVIAFPYLYEMRTVGWQNRNGLEQIAHQTIEELQQEAIDRGLRPQQAVLYVYAEPALFFHICKEMPATRAIGTLKFASAPSQQSKVPIFFLYGPHAIRTAQFQQQWNENQHRFKLIQSYDYHPSDLVLLNQYDPAALVNKADRPVEKVYLYQLQH